MKNLETVQKVFGVFKILSRVFMILCFVAAGFCLVSGIIFLADSDAVIGKIGDVTIKLPVIISTDAELDNNYYGSYLLAFFAGTLCEGILLALAHRYFSLEQKEGTPFTENGAKTVLNLGIWAIILSVVSSAAQSVIISFMGMSDFSEMFDGLSNEYGIILGVSLILLSLVLRYGADLEQKNKQSE